MSFGNRPSGPDSRPPRRTGGGFDPSHIKIKQQGFDWGGLVTGLAWVVIVISIGTIGYTLLAGSSAVTPPPPPKHQSLAIFAGEPVAKARHYKRTGKVTGGWPDMNTVNLEVERTDTGLSAIDSELHERCTKPISKFAAMWSIERGKAVFHITHAPKFLTCIMKHQRSRLCQASYRKRLADRISAYVKVHKSINKRFAFVMKDQVQQDLARQIRKSQKEMRKLERDVKRSFRNSRMSDEQKRAFGAAFRTPSNNPGGITSGHSLLGPMISKSFAKSLNSLSKMGLLGAKDFNGLFSKPPEEILPYLVDVPNPC